MTQPETAQAAVKPRGKLTNADYLAMTPPAGGGARYQLINGELIEMSGASDPHQVFLMWLCSGMLLQVDALGIGEIRIPPYDVHIDRFNTYQPDLLYVSNERRHIFNPDGHGVSGAPDVVVEILSDSTRRRDLNEKLPVYIASGVREAWIVDLEDATLTVHSADAGAAGSVAVFTAEDMLTSAAMPGVAIELGAIFARALG